MAMKPIGQEEGMLPHPIKARRLIAYRTPPVDWWDGWVKAATVLKAHGTADFNVPWINPQEFSIRWLAAQRAAGQLLWEGDIRQGPFVCPLPASGDGGPDDYIISWKQDNNGTTFVASPEDLPWVHERCERHTSIIYWEGGISIDELISPTEGQQADLSALFGDAVP
jgi:hypothetical protein